MAAVHCYRSCAISGGEAAEMNLRFKPGHLAGGGELLLALIRNGICACGADFEGPPIQKRCEKCRVLHRRAYQRRYWRKMKAKP